MKKVDLHIHTVATVSDHYFEFSMDTLQSYVECKELDAIAVTNHNLFDRKQYEEICEKISVPVFPGIEIDVEQGHLLLITSPDDLDDFEPRCKHIQGKNSTNTSWISEDDLLEYFPNIGKYILIPHYDKSPKLELHRIPKIKDYITCGEVTSVKKFISMKKRNEELVPILFSDERMENRGVQFPDRQTFIDIEELSINALKHALRDRAKVSLSPDEGNVLFQILDNGLQISTGLTVVLGGRSSGKSYTLDAINDQYEHAAYIRQFELLARDEEADKRRFDELLRRKGDSITQEFLQPFRNVIDNVQAVDLRADEREIETYLEMLKKSAAEVERQDAFAKAKLFSETLFDIKDLSSLKKLIEAVDVLISNLEYRELINSHIERKSLLNLAISLRKKYISESQLASAMKCVNDIVGNIKTELSSRTTNTVIPEIDFYRILLNQRKIEKFVAIVKGIQQKRIIEQKSVHSFNIVAKSRPFNGAQELHSVFRTSDALTPLYEKYNDPYEYLCSLRKNQNIPSSEYHKFFAYIEYEVLNKYGTKASGGERSEYNLLQRVKDALQEDILILDEPESSFDNIFLKDGVDVLLKELSEHIPVVIATHNNTIGASVHPDFLIYTEKEITPDGAITYHLYSGYPTSEELTDLEGNKLKRRSIMLNCLEAGEEAYLERSKTYEVSLH